MAKSIEQIQNAIIELTAAERITKRLLGELSRDVLEYVVDNEDVRPINMLLGIGEDGKFVLTAANWRIACLYFHHFVPFTSNYKDVADLGINKGRRSPQNTLVFAKKSKKKWDKGIKAIIDWLANEDNNIWGWQADNIETKKAKDFAGDITKVVAKALQGDDDNEALTLEQVLDAVIDADGVDAQTLMAALFAKEKDGE